MKIFGMGLLFSILPVLAHSATIHVPKDQPAIQAGIDAAVAGDVVLVAPGTYVECIDFKGKAVLVMSDEGPESTIIDGNKSGSVVSFESNEGPSSRIEGFTITNGNGTYESITGCFCGGGVFCNDSAPVIRRNLIKNNMVSAIGAVGGGIFCQFGSPRIEGNTIEDNVAVNGSGGGIFCHYCTGNPVDQVITDNVISSNSARYGGGFYAVWCGDQIITNNMFIDNFAGDGGGLFFWGTHVEAITNNNILNNEATFSGGGIYAVSNAVTVTNSILWNNAAPAGKEIVVLEAFTTGILDISHSIVEGGIDSVYVDPMAQLIWGPCVFLDDPKFLDPIMGDFHVPYESPCQFWGKRDAPGLPDEDFEGDPRIEEIYPDIGMDELHAHLYYLGDAVPGGTIQVKLVDFPWKKPVGLWIGTKVLEVPISTSLGDWYLDAPYSGPIDLGEIPYPDSVIVLTGTIPSSPPGPYTFYLQALIKDKLTNLCAVEVK